MWREHLGVNLQAQFAIVRGPARFLDQNILWYIITACVIMHNMIIENERGQELDYTHYDLMGVSIQVRRREERLAQFITHTMPFVKEKSMINFNLISSSSGENGMGNNEQNQFILSFVAFVVLLFRHTFYSFELFIVDVICVVIIIKLFIVNFICVCLIFM
jgi:hypothetical protein